MVYTFKRRTDTDEIHFFEGEWTEKEGECTVPIRSICQKMTRGSGTSLRLYTLDSVEKINCSCNEEDLARLNAAKIGREVCGTCVSHLYKSY